MRYLISCVCALVASCSVLAEALPMIEVTRLVGAPVGDVWNAWTTSEGFDACFDGPRLDEIELRPGGPFVIHWKPDAPEGERGSETCTVLSFVPERMLSFTWNAPPELGAMRDEHSFVVVEFQPLGETLTRVTLRHSGFGEGEAWQSVREYFEPAWPWVLDQFVKHLGSPPPYLSGYVMFLNPARDDFFESPTPEEGAKIQEHFTRLHELTKAGVVLFAGPCTDQIGPGIVLFEASSEAEAREIMEADPAVASGVFTAELHPIGFSLLRERDRL